MPRSLRGYVASVGRRSVRLLVLCVVAVGVLPMAPSRADCVRLAPVKIGRCHRAEPEPARETDGRDRIHSKRSRGGAATVVRLVNSERARHGLEPLRRRAYLDGPAVRHARRMAREQRLYHNRWIHSEAGRKALRYPRTTAENVGLGGSVSSIHRAFMRSASHRTNILLSGVSEVGVAAFEGGGGLWVVQVFVQPGGGRAGRASEAAVPGSSSSGKRAEGSGGRASASEYESLPRPSAPTSLSQPAPLRSHGAVVFILALATAGLLRRRSWPPKIARWVLSAAARLPVIMRPFPTPVPKGGWPARLPAPSNVHTLTEEHDDHGYLRVTASRAP